MHENTSHPDNVSVSEDSIIHIRFSQATWRLKGRLCPPKDNSALLWNVALFRITGLICPVFRSFCPTGQHTNTKKPPAGGFFLFLTGYLISSAVIYTPLLTRADVIL